MSTATLDETGQRDEGPSSLFSSIMLGQQSSSTNAGLQCGFCGSQCSPLQLQTCLFCGSVAYCSKDHQQFDWNTHKMICKSLQSRGLVPSNLIPAGPSLSAVPLPPLPPTVSFDDPALTTSLLLSLQKNALMKQPTSTFSIAAPPEVPANTLASSAPFSSEGSAFRPYRSGGGHVFNSFSSESVSSMCTNSLGNMSSNSLTRLPTSNSEALNLAAQSVTGTEKIILTDDPDIQIIETEGTTTATTKAHVSRTRKRPTPSNSVDPKINYKDHNKNVVYSTTLQEHQKHLQNRGLALNIHQAMVLRLRYIAEHVIRSLNEFGWSVIDNFLGSDHYKYTAKEIERLYERGLFSPGQLMEGKHKDEFHIKDIRSDHIYWYDGCDQRAKDAATVRLLISMIDSVIQHFKNRIDHDIGGRSRAMLAIYPGNGTRYVKHVDNPVKDGRCITTIYYCNESWDMAKDGGTLRLYPETSMTPMDVDPRADRLVFFWSDRRNPHEVMPVFRHRFAITIWYMDRTERDKALAKGKETEAAAKKENDPVSPVQLTAGSRPRKNPSSHELSKLDLRLFPSTSSDPNLGDEKVVDPQSAEIQSTSASFVHPESTDSGVSLSTLNDSDHHHHHHHLERTSSLQSISDHFRSQRRSSTSSEQELDESLPAAPATNPEYMI